MENDTPKNPSPKKPVRKPAGARRPAKADTPAKEHEGERIAKVMARVGLCSRRDAEIWIEQGRVAVNGEKLTSAARNVTAEDRVTVDGKPLAARERTRLFMFHKPRGLVTTDRDPEGRPTVFEYIAEKYPSLPRLMSIGRLDINTEGLLLLTNDGGLARVLELPSTGWLRRYRARANGQTDQARLDTLAKGVTIDGVDYAGVEARLDRVQGANVWISLGLREGKNREVKRLLEHLGLGVNRLIRLSYGPFQLGEMADGTVDEVRPRVLADQLGSALAEEANVDFEGPTLDHAPPPEREFSERPKRGAAPPRGERPERGAKPERGEPAPRKSFASQEKPEPRKHVSALRNDRVKAETGPRRRTERAATADRNGRTVVVERVSVARRAEPAPDTRNARRFRDEREQRETGEPRFEGRKSAPRGERSGAPRAEKFKSAPRTERSASASRTERPKGETGAAKTFRRGERDAAGAAPRSEARPRGERKFGDRPSGDRPRGDRPSGDRPRGDRPSGGKSFGDKPFGDRPARGKPAGRKPFGDKPSGGKTFGKPSGGRPSGPGKPRGK
jgi:23S rRNA pseudouridine2605 synthase